MRRIVRQMAAAALALGLAGATGAGGITSSHALEHAGARLLGVTASYPASDSLVWYTTSSDAPAYWAGADLALAGSDRDEHDSLMDSTLTTLASWFADSPDGTAAETDGGALPQMGLLMTRDGATPRAVCSATIVSSPTADRVLTAAHCLAGITSDLVFVPGYHDGTAPYGVWPVAAAAIDPRYGDSPAGDQAVLKIAERNGQLIEDVVGGLPVRYDAAPQAQTVVMAGYPYATSEPRLCRSTMSSYTEAGHGFFDMHCAAMPSGVSGGPWLVDDDGTVALIGITGGGKDGGGYCDDESVANPLTEDATRRLIEGDISRDDPVLAFPLQWPGA